MKLKFALLGLLLTVGACSQLQSLLPVAEPLATMVLTPAQIANMQAVCVAAKPALDAAVAPTTPSSVSQVAVYPKAFCDQLAAGQLPPTTDTNSPSWLPSVLADVKTAATIAGVLLPLL